MSLARLGCSHSIYVFPQSRTTTGIKIASEPFSKLERHITATSLGEHVLRALEASCEGVALPSDLKAVTAAILRFTGFRSWKAFAKSASGAYLEFDDLEVRIIPLSAYRDGSFGYSEEQAVRCSLEPEVVGHSLFALITGQ